MEELNRYAGVSLLASLRFAINLSSNTFNMDFYWHLLINGNLHTISFVEPSAQAGGNPRQRRVCDERFERTDACRPSVERSHNEYPKELPERSWQSDKVF
jgi:hypothetical protein